MTLLSAHVALYAVVRFSTAFAFAVVLAFAFALVAVRALSFPRALAVAAAFAVSFALALAFAFAFALACVIHVHCEIVHDPRLLRVQVGLNDRSQLVVVAFKLLGVHQQMVSQFQWRLTTLIFTSSSSFADERF